MAAQRFAFHQFGDDVGNLIFPTDIVDGDDIWMIESAGRSRFLFEAPQRGFIIDAAVVEDFYRDVAMQPSIAGSIDFAHRACAQQGDNFIGS